MGKIKAFIVYHWAPRERRASILRHGLKPRSSSRDGTWYPPYVCYSDSPALAWFYSGATSKKAEEWDLWMVRSDTFTVLKKREDMKHVSPTEYRTHETAPPKKIWLVGSRQSLGRKERRNLL